MGLLGVIIRTFSTGNQSNGITQNGSWARIRPAWALGMMGKIGKYELTFIFRFEEFGNCRDGYKGASVLSIYYLELYFNLRGRG